MHSQKSFPSTTAHRLWCTGAMIFGLAMSACGKEGKKPDTAASAPAQSPSAAQDTYTTSAAGTPGDEPVSDAPTDPLEPTAPLPAGTLPSNKKIEDYESDPAKFWIFVKGKGWSGWDRQRKCKGHTDCDNGAPKTKMRIQAIRDANNVRISALPAMDVVIGRMMNRGKYEDATTHTPGGQKWPDHYYFVIRKVDNATATLKVAILSFEQTGQHRPTALVVKKGEELYHACDPAGHAPGAAEGDFKNCTRRATNDPNGDLAKATTIDAFAWFSCAEGCCTAQYPPFTAKGADVPPRKSGVK